MAVRNSTSNTPRPIKTSHADTRPRTRSRSMTFVETQLKSGVTFEVENFRIYGDLRKTETEVRNTLPTASTIQTEKTLLCFENQRKITPGEADYTHFYRCLSASVTSLPVSRSVPPQDESDVGTSVDKGDNPGDSIIAESGQYLRVVPSYLQN